MADVGQYVFYKAQYELLQYQIQNLQQEINSIKIQINKLNQDIIPRYEKEKIQAITAYNNDVVKDQRGLPDNRVLQNISQKAILRQVGQAGFAELKSRIAGYWLYWIENTLVKKQELLKQKVQARDELSEKIK